MSASKTITCKKMEFVSKSAPTMNSMIKHLCLANANSLWADTMESVKSVPLTTLPVLSLSYVSPVVLIKYLSKEPACAKVDMHQTSMEYVSLVDRSRILFSFKETAPHVRDKRSTTVEAVCVQLEPQVLD